MKGLLILWLASSAAAQQVSLRAEKLYHDSLFAYTKGDYKTALEGFMDVLLEDPAYPGARDRLNSTALRLRALEEQKIEQERKQLMSDIELAHNGTIKPAAAPKDYYEEKPGFMDEWRALIKAALARAKDPRALPKTMAAYEKALKAFPVRHDDSSEYLEARAALQKRLLAAFPHMDSDPAWKQAKAGRFNTGDFAAAVFTEKHYAERWKNNSHGLFVFAQKDTSDSNAELAARVSESEKRLGEESKLAYNAYLKFAAEKYRESAELWQALLALDPDNPEALFHLERAKKESAAVPAPAPAPAPRPVPVRKVKAPEAKPAPVPPEPAEPAPKEGKEEAAQDYYLKGLRDYSLGKLDDAILHWRACLELNPSHPKAKKALERALAEKTQ